MTNGRDYTWGEPLPAGDSRHGITGYSNYGCKCEVCMAASREQVRARRATNALYEPPVHGTPSTYENWSCRCEPCRAAKSKQMRELRARLMGTEPRRHGTNIAYNLHGCRCEKCKGWSRSRESHRTR